MWFDESVFYQIYPLGFCGAEGENDFGEVRHRLDKIEKKIDELKKLGVGAILFNPLFESERHGYDTVDFFKVDRRLGTNEEFKSLVEKLHKAGIKVVLDGVFNHVGRKFFAFQEVLEKREGTDYRFWFNIDFCGNSSYGDGLGYKCWEGHQELVSLRLEHPDCLNYVTDAVKFWIREFGIDGLRLDVCYMLPEWFMRHLRNTVNAERPNGDFFLVGEVIHCQNFAQHVCPEKLNSITGYECYKGLVSSINTNNLFEIEYSLSRLFSDVSWALFPKKNLLNFADNHDVSRAYTALDVGNAKKNIFNLYSILFTMPGIPCLYYGSEYAAEGNKSEGDASLRLTFEETLERADKAVSEKLYRHIETLCKIRHANSVLSYGGYRKRILSNRHMVIERFLDGKRICLAVNIDENEVRLNLENAVGRELLTGDTVNANELVLAPFSAKIIEF